jgi:hypothetical protein
LCGLALEARTALAASLLLNDERSLTDAGTTYELLDLDLHEIATPKLAVDRKVEERAITEAMLLLQEEAHRPNLLWQEWPLGTKLSANIPRRAVSLTGIVDCMSHALSPQANSGREENVSSG